MSYLGSAIVLPGGWLDKLRKAAFHRIVNQRAAVTRSDWDNFFTYLHFCDARIQYSNGLTYYEISRLQGIWPGQINLTTQKLDNISAIWRYRIVT